MDKETNGPTNDSPNNVDKPDNGITNGPIDGSQQNGIGNDQGGLGGSPQRVANDPERVGGPEAKKRRGRPALTAEQKEANARARAATGTGQKEDENQSRKSARALGLDAGLLAQQIQGLHAVAAMLTAQPLLQIEDGQAKALAKSITDLVTYYQLDLAGPVTLWVQLAATVGMIYFPKLLMIQQMRAMAKQAPRASVPGSDLVMQPQGPINFENAA